MLIVSYTLRVLFRLRSTQVSPFDVLWLSARDWLASEVVVLHVRYGRLAQVTQAFLAHLGWLMITITSCHGLLQLCHNFDTLRVIDALTDYSSTHGDNCVSYSLVTTLVVTQFAIDSTTCSSSIAGARSLCTEDICVLGCIDEVLGVRGHHLRRLLPPLTAATLYKVLRIRTHLLVHQDYLSWVSASPDFFHF